MSEAPPALGGARVVSRANPPAPPMLDYANDLPLTEPRLDGRPDGGVVLTLPPRPRWLHVAVLVWSIVLLGLVVLFWVMLIPELFGTQSKVNLAGAWLVTIVYVPNILLLAAFVIGLALRLRNWSKLSRRLECVDGRLTYVVPGPWGRCRSVSRPADQVRQFAVELKGKTLTGRRSVQLQTDGLTIRFSTDDAELCDRIAAAFRRALQSRLTEPRPAG